MQLNKKQKSQIILLKDDLTRGTTFIRNQKIIKIVHLHILYLVDCLIKAIRC